MNVVRRLLSRLAQAAAILLVLSFALFGLLSQLPGDPVDLLITANPNIRPDDVVRLKKLRGLDKPWPVRYWRWLIGHDEARAPPRAPPRDPIVIELPADGPASVDFAEDGSARKFFAPGLYRHPFVVGDGALEDVGVQEIFVGPTISAVPTPLDRVKQLDETERQLGGSTEDAAGVGRASQLEVMNAARAIGARLPAIAAPTTVDVDDDLRASFSLPPGATIVRGPGRIQRDAWQHTFDKPGRTVIVFEVASAEDPRITDRGAFVVEHGAVVDPERFHRGAIFAFIGDTEALGWSFTYKRPVWELLFGPPLDDDERGPAQHILHFGRVQHTIMLVLPALLLSLLFAIPLGTWAAMRRGTFIDRVINAISIALLSMPAFWLGIIAILVFAARLQWLPATGVGEVGVDPTLGAVIADRARHMIMPVSVLALVYTGQWIRYVRSGVLEVLPQDFVRTARAKGLAPVDVARHALQNALIPLITVIALAAPQLFAGALLTETVFAWPGVGRLQYEAVLNNDSYVAIVVFLVSATLVMFANLIADALYVVVDPRLRRSKTDGAR